MSDCLQYFPAEYHKTKDYGYSLMDTGVGSFVFMAGLVAPEARAGAVQDNKIKVHYYYIVLIYYLSAPTMVQALTALFLWILCCLF